jgi:hypothetical protein
MNVGATLLTLQIDGVLCGCTMTDGTFPVTVAPVLVY